MLSPSPIPAVTYAVGDIHGRIDLLQALLAQIRNHRKQIDGSAKLVFLGDYVDRGPKAGQRAVLELLRSGTLRQEFDEVVILKGNHEAMLIESIERFQEGLRDEIPAVVLRARYGHLEKIFGMRRYELKAFLQSLSLWHSDGIRLFTHAGIPEDVEIETLPEEQLLWYRGPVRDRLGRLVVHGHTPIPRGPSVSKYAVNIDTGAYATGQLTCAVFLGASRTPRFLSTPANPKETDRFERALKAE